jgi:hypothetical protein
MKVVTTATAAHGEEDLSGGVRADAQNQQITGVNKPINERLAKHCFNLVAELDMIEMIVVSDHL